MVEKRTAIVTGLAARDIDQTAGDFFARFVDGAEDLDLGTLPAGEAFDLLFEDDP